MKDFAHFFEHLEQRRVDVAFSYYDGTRSVPWGSNEELARTKKRLGGTEELADGQGRATCACRAAC